YDEPSLSAAAVGASHDDTGYGAGNLVRGNVTTHQVWQSTPGNFPGETFAYDITGSVVSWRDFDLNQTSFNYTDATHVNPTTVVNALASAGSRSYTYDQSTLKATAVVDENG